MRDCMRPRVPLVDPRTNRFWRTAAILQTQRCSVCEIDRDISGAERGHDPAQDIPRVDPLFQGLVDLCVRHCRVANVEQHAATIPDFAHHLLAAPERGAQPDKVRTLFRMIGHHEIPPMQCMWIKAFYISKTTICISSPSPCDQLTTRTFLPVECDTKCCGHIDFDHSRSACTNCRTIRGPLPSGRTKCRPGSNARLRQLDWRDRSGKIALQNGCQFSTSALISSNLSRNAAS